LHVALRVVRWPKVRRAKPMTEAEWFECREPQKMLDWLRAAGKLSDRKARLFAAAACRRIWHLLVDERSRRAVEATELFADGLATEADAEAAGNAAAEVTSDDTQGVPEQVGWRAARAADHLVPLPEEAWQLHVAWEYAATAMEGEQLVKGGATPEMLDTWSEQSVESGSTMSWTSVNPDALVADILREVVGPIPFRPLPLTPSFKTWNNHVVQRLAEAAYNERQLPAGALDVARLAVLADALEEAACDDAGLLSHLRSPGPHVRGCAVIDALLGKS
jgi:hypothetical protein